jgi:hypothetical protein
MPISHNTGFRFFAAPELPLLHADNGNDVTAGHLARQPLLDEPGDASLG